MKINVGTPDRLARVIIGAMLVLLPFFSGLAHLPSLSKENQELKDELAAAHAEDAVNDLIQVQNEELQGLLDLRATLDPEPIAAVVIANGLSNFEWTITIDKGSNDGIAKDQPGHDTGDPRSDLKTAKFWFAQALSEQADRLIVGQMPGVLDAAGMEQANTRLVAIFSMLDRLIAPPSPDHPLWPIVETAVRLLTAK